MVGRPETHPVKKVIGFTEQMIEAVESWRAKQKPVPNLSEAIRRLVEIGLSVPSKARKQSRSGAGRAKELAARAVEKLIDPSLAPEHRAHRRRQLTKGPAEFREDRVDQPKAKKMKTARWRSG